MKHRSTLFTTILLAICFSAFSCLVFPQRTQAVVPAPDGGYPNFTTAEGQNALFSLTTGAANTAVGWFSLWGNATGEFNTATGAGALLFNNGDPTAGEASGNTAFGAAALLFNTTGGSNTAVGAAALLNNTTGVYNTAIGNGALYSNTTGSFNTANGLSALFENTTGGVNTAIGQFALFFNTTGDANTALGISALYSNTSGFGNTAVGASALSLSTGDDNTATGWNALGSNTTGQSNTANGYGALFSSSASNFNTATGFQALKNTTGERNTATGADALLFNTDGAGNTADGNNALRNITTGSSGNIALGAEAGTNLNTGSNNIYLGSLGVATESNTLRIGTSGTQDRAFIRGIRGVTTGNNDAVPVLIDTAGQLGTTSSSRRYKKDIKPMEQASKAILSLKPVTFHYKSDTKDTPQFGLIAEEVAELNPDLVVRDENGEIYTVRYDAVNAMLLNEFLKEHRKVEEQSRKIQEQEATIAELRSDAAYERTTISGLKNGIETVVAHLKEQDSRIQKVSDQIEINKAGPGMVWNNSRKVKSNTGSQ